MKTSIEETSFGTITINGITYDHDVIIRMNGEIKKRKKKLSKAIYGTSHTLSLEEARYIYDKGATRLIIGSGQYGALGLSDKANDYFKKKKCQVDLLPTPDALNIWNKAGEDVIGLFHVTC